MRSQVDADGDEDFDSERFFAYDGNQIVLAFDGDSDTDLTNRYLWGPVVDQILADEQVTSLGSAGDVIWPLTDHLGTARDLAEYTDGPDTTAITNHRIYDSFGNLVSETNSAVDHLFGFTARPWDEETDLQYNLNRWYDPVIGQWMSEDPIGFAAGDANVRRYVGNSVTDHLDAHGLDSYVNPGALQSSITTSQNALADARTKLSARLASIEAAHAKYAYFKPFNLDALFRDMNSKLPRITVVENSAWAWAGGAAAQWHYTTNSLAFNGTIAQAADPTLLHELTHMLDDLHGWYLNGNLRPDMRKVEGLGYAVQHIFDNIFMLQRFEDGFAKGTYKSCKDISDAWHAAWLQIGSYGNTNVWTGGNDRGPLTSADITDFENRTAVNISHDAVYDTYAKMASAYAQMNFSCSYSLPRESVKKEIQ